MGMDLGKRKIKPLAPPEPMIGPTLDPGEPVEPRYIPLDRPGIRYIANDGLLIEVWEEGELTQVAFSSWRKYSFFADGEDPLKKIEPTPGRCIVSLPKMEARWLINELTRRFDANQ